MAKMMTDRLVLGRSYRREDGGVSTLTTADGWTYTDQRGVGYNSDGEPTHIGGHRTALIPHTNRLVARVVKMGNHYFTLAELESITSVPARRFLNVLDRLQEDRDVSND